MPNLIYRGFEIEGPRNGMYRAVSSDGEVLSNWLPSLQAVQDFIDRHKRMGGS